MVPAVPVARVGPARDLVPAVRVAPAVAVDTPPVGPGRVDPVVRAVLVGLVGLDLAVPAVPVDPVVRDRAVPAARVGPAIPADLMARVGLADLRGPADRVVRADLRGLAVPVGRDPAVLGDLTVARVGLKGRVDPVGLVTTTPAARVGPVDLGITAQVGPVVRADLGITVRVGLVTTDLAVPVGHRHLRMSSTVSTTTEAPIGVAPTMRRTASVRRTTARRRLRGNVDLAGTVDLLPVPRRRTGMDRHLLEAGTDRLLPGAGTRVGTGHRVTSDTHSEISDRSRTTATTPSRCSTRCSADGASGSSESGFRCTDVDPTD